MDAQIDYKSLNLPALQYIIPSYIRIITIARSKFLIWSFKFQKLKKGKKNKIISFFFSVNLIIFLFYKRNIINLCTQATARKQSSKFWNAGRP